MRWWLVSIIPHCSSCCWEADGPFRSACETAAFAERHRRGRDHTILRAAGRVPAIQAAISLREEDSAGTRLIPVGSRGGYEQALSDR